LPLLLCFLRRNGICWSGWHMKPLRISRLAGLHPSLRFKKVHATLPIYSARVDLDWRAVGVLKEGTVRSPRRRTTSCLVMGATPGVLETEVLADPHRWLR